jgi:TolB-like protein
MGFILVLISVISAENPKLAILPLLNRGIDSSESHVISDALSDAFVHIKDIRVMERQQMNEILKEQGFEETGLCDSSECAIQTGKILGIDEIITGSIGKINGKYIMSLRRVSISSGEILASTSKSGPIDKFLNQQLQDIACELMGRPSTNLERYQPGQPNYQYRNAAFKRFSDSSLTAMKKMNDSSRTAIIENSKRMADSLSKMWAPAAAEASMATNGEAAKAGMKALEEAIKHAQDLAKNGYTKPTEQDQK